MFFSLLMLDFQVLLISFSNFPRGAMKKHVQECHEEEDEVDASGSPADGKFSFLYLKNGPNFWA